MAESPIQSSFIPREQSAPQGVARLRPGGLYDLFMLVAIVLFIASAVLAAGVYLYVQFLESQSRSKLEQLERAKEAFQPALIQKITRLDDRMRTADELLATHLAPTVFFRILEQATLSTIYFRSLDFNLADPQNMTLKMNGLAQSVNSVALQADLFSKSNIMTSPIFTGINRQGSFVNFEVNAKINPSTMKYSQFVQGQSAAAAQQVEQQQMQEAAEQPSASPFTGEGASN